MAEIGLVYSEKLMEIYGLLYDRYGPQHWWPGDSRIEIIVGAILTQNTNWGNVEKAIANLKSAGCLTVGRLGEVDIATLSELIRPAGYYNIKARRLKNFMEWLYDQPRAGSLDAADAAVTELLREQLLTVKGIGPETADSILLYAFERYVFVVDTYTYRVLGRHGLLDHDNDYEQIRDLFESNLRRDVGLFNEYHALLVRLGKEHCRPKAKCRGCPLESLAPNAQWPACEI